VPATRRRLILVGILFLAALTGCHRWEHAGGGWYVRRTETLPEAGGRQPFLFRGAGLRRRPVLEFTYVYRYYGDDCLGFAATRGIYFACGERRPIQLNVPGYPALHDLSFEPAGARSRPLVESVGPALLFSAAELKKRAITQPVIPSYDFDAVRVLVQGTPNSGGSAN